VPLSLRTPHRAAINEVPFAPYVTHDFGVCGGNTVNRPRFEAGSYKICGRCIYASRLRSSISIKLAEVQSSTQGRWCPLRYLCRLLQPRAR
jgi:hypothetical protein